VQTCQAPSTDKIDRRKKIHTDNCNHHMNARRLVTSPERPCIEHASARKKNTGSVACMLPCRSHIPQFAVAQYQMTKHACFLQSCRRRSWRQNRGLGACAARSPGHDLMGLLSSKRSSTLKNMIKTRCAQSLEFTFRVCGSRAYGVVI